MAVWHSGQPWELFCSWSMAAPSAEPQTASVVPRCLFLYSYSPVSPGRKGARVSRRGPGVLRQQECSVPANFLDVRKGSTLQLRQVALIVLQSCAEMQPTEQSSVRSWTVQKRTKHQTESIACKHLWHYHQLEHHVEAQCRKYQFLSSSSLSHSMLMNHFIDAGTKNSGSSLCILDRFSQVHPPH